MSQAHGLSNASTPSRRGRLLAIGWALAASLPVSTAALLFLDYQQYRDQLQARSDLAIEAVERQLRYRLAMVEHQLAQVARGTPAPPRWFVPMHDAKVRASAPRPERAAPLRFIVGAPVHRREGWRLPVAVQDREGPLATAEIDVEVLGQTVEGLAPGPNYRINLIHSDGRLLVRSPNDRRWVGRMMSDAPLFDAAHRNRLQGTFSQRSVIDGVPRQFTYRRLRGLPLIVVVGAEQRSHWLGWTALAAGIFGLSLLLGLAWAALVRKLQRAQGDQARLIHDLKAAVASLETTQQRLHQAHKLALLGEYEWDLGAGLVHWGEETFRIYGLDPSPDPMPVDKAFAPIHADDVGALKALAASILEGAPSVEVQFRIVRPDGAIRYIQGRGERVLAPDGREIIRGVQQDVTELVQARERISAAEAEYRFLFEHNPLPMWVFDRETLRFLAVNDAMLEHYGYSREELLNASLVDIRPAEEVSALRAAVELAEAKRPQGRIWTHLHKSGRVMRMAIFSHDIVFEGRKARLVAAQDVTEREHSDERFRMVARATSDAVYDYDIVAGKIWWSDSFNTRFGHASSDVAQSVDDWALLIHPGDRERVSASLETAIEGLVSEWQEEYRFRRGDGSYAAVLDRGFVLRDATGSPIRMVGGMIDISERLQYEEQLAHRATHDELTGLPNRQLLQDRLQQAVLNAHRYGHQAALVFIDLDDFKLINDNLGHSAGDAVLREVATRLQALAFETETVGRFGGDEFIMVLTEQADDEHIHRRLSAVMETMARPIGLTGISHALTASIGWCRYPEAGTDAEALLKHADLAMYHAKRQGRNRAVAYRPEFMTSLSQRLQLVAELRQALEREEFTLLFQPLFDRSSRPTALEALVRWQHPERGLLPPAQFIPICEESGLIVELGRWVLRTAARHHAELARMGLGALRISVNVSAAQFGEELAGHVAGVVDECALPAGVLELEITESVLMADPPGAIALMKQIASLGVTFSIDDFGTGYSSLAYLKNFPIDRLKIDRSFVQDLSSDRGDAAICESIIGLAHALGIGTVAEGVEDHEQLAWLREHGVDEVQGFLLGKPEVLQRLFAQLQGAAPSP